MPLDGGPRITRLGETFFAEVTEIDISQPLDDELFEVLHQAALEHAVLAFKVQHLTDEQQVAFSKRFGPLEDDLMEPSQHVAFMSNRESDGSLRDLDSRLSKFLRSNQQWHSDSTFYQAPARYSFLSARRMPATGGATQWADLQAAWEALPASRQAELDGLILEHDFQRSRMKEGLVFTDKERAKWRPLRHPLVRRHEETGAKCLYVGSQAETVVGWAEDAGKGLIDELRDFCAQDRFVHTHEWDEGDIVMWDNRRVNHRGRPWDEGAEARIMHRTSGRGTGPTMENGAAVDEYERWRNAS